MSNGCWNLRYDVEVVLVHNLLFQKQFQWMLNMYQVVGIWRWHVNQEYNAEIVIHIPGEHDAET